MIHIYFGFIFHSMQATVSSRQVEMLLVDRKLPVAATLCKIYNCHN